MKVKEISFYKKVKCWYAEVPEHTEAENLMVSGADELCEAMACGKKRVTIRMAYGDKVDDYYKRIGLTILVKKSSTRWGATYVVIRDGKGKEFPDSIWLCNVTKTVCGGEHPNEIVVLSVEPNDFKPYGGMLRPAI